MVIGKMNGIAQLRSGASKDTLNALEAQLGTPLPPEYRALLSQADGFACNNGLLIYSASEVAERNETFEVMAYAPGYLAIGDDSGGRSILVSKASQGVFLADQGSMDPDDFESVATSLSDWISRNCTL